MKELEKISEIAKEICICSMKVMPHHLAREEETKIAPPSGDYDKAFQDGYFWYITGKE